MRTFVIAIALLPRVINPLIAITLRSLRGRGAENCDEYRLVPVRLIACLLAILQKYSSKLNQIFCTC